MRVGIVFLAIALVFGGFAFQGLVTESVQAFSRSERDALLLDANPMGFSISLVLHSLSAAIFFALAVFFFWSARQTKAAEERFFAQRDLLGPRKD